MNVYTERAQARFVVRQMNNAARAWVRSPEGHRFPSTPEHLDTALAAFKAGWLAALADREQGA